MIFQTDLTTIPDPAAELAAHGIVAKVYGDVFEADPDEILMWKFRADWPSAFRPWINAGGPTRR